MCERRYLVLLLTLAASGGGGGAANLELVELLLDLLLEAGVRLLEVELALELERLGTTRSDAAATAHLLLLLRRTHAVVVVHVVLLTRRHIVSFLRPRIHYQKLQQQNVNH